MQALINKLKTFFQRPEKSIQKLAGDSKQQVELAAAVLLLQIAGADGDYDPEETKRIYAVIEKTFALSHPAAEAMLSKADKIRSNREQLDQFFTDINANLNAKEKEFIYMLVWKVVLADKKVDKLEKRFATQVRYRLQLSDEAEARARKRAESEKL
ncbi:TerB family tellurite resistance protein [bacterium]|nr:TerB family tellurite resistance protein [bacterium]